MILLEFLNLRKKKSRKYSLALDAHIAFALISKLGLCYVLNGGLVIH